MTNNHLENNTQKAKDRSTRTPLKTGGERGFSGRVLTCDVRRVILVINPVISHECEKDFFCFLLIEKQLQYHFFFFFLLIIPKG